MSSTVVGTLTRGKVSREVLNEVFGPSLLGIVEAARMKDEDSSTMNRRRPRVTGSTTNTSGAAGGGGDLEGKEREEEDDYHDDRDLADELAGSDTTPGKLQVRVVEKNQRQTHARSCLETFSVCPDIHRHTIHALDVFEMVSLIPDRTHPSTPPSSLATDTLSHVFEVTG